jgi:hypothetical protein
LASNHLWSSTGNSEAVVKTRALAVLAIVGSNDSNTITEKEIPVFLKTIAAIFATALVPCGQADSGSTNSSTMIFPPPLQAFDDLKKYVGLNDGQVEQLRKLLEERSAASEEISKRINEKQTELYTLLRSGSRDLPRLGQLTLDIHTLSTQAPPSNEQWRQRALSILTQDQRNKLVPLDQAMKLSPTAYQAVTLNLVDPPPPGRVIILGGPADGTPAPLPRPVPTLPGPAPVPLPEPSSSVP